ncbi:MAG: hypothetical protein AB9842_08265 [Bacteroidales bacterium]
MPSQITVIIKIDPHLKAYLVKLYGPEPIVFPRKHRFNNVLIRLLDKPARNSAHYFIRDYNTVEIVLPYNDVKNINCYNYLGFHNQIEFRKAVWIDFISDFEEFVIEYKLKNLERKEAILKFMEFFNISEEGITFDAFYRYFSRMQKKHRQRKLTAMSKEFLSVNPNINSETPVLNEL